MVLSDCDTALNLNNKYVKALDRRAKTLRKQAMKIENFEIQVRFIGFINKNSLSFALRLLTCFMLHEIANSRYIEFKICNKSTKRGDRDAYFAEDSSVFTQIFMVEKSKVKMR